ncbi:MAG: response regulator [Candidatus Marinimicrobia bacterium]|nr:response regulator [Candidatus Neomarinimicrobiota bacterium]
MSELKNLLVIEQHKQRAEEIANDAIELFDYYFVATSVRETEAFIREYDIDMIIINPFFTDGSGRQFIEILRKNTHLHTTPILIMSRLPEDKVKVDFYSFGADGYIQYPYDKNELISKIQRKLHTQIQLKKIEETSGNILSGFHPRDEFEAHFNAESNNIAAQKSEGILGIIAPVGMDAIMRDIGMDQGDHLMTALANLMREMFSAKMNASAWTHKMIVFYSTDDDPTQIESMEGLRQRYLLKMEDAIGEQKLPGFRSVMSVINPKLSLDMQMRRLAGQLMSMDKHPELAPVQFLGDTVSSKRHILIFDPDPVSCQIIAYNLKKEGYIPFLLSKLHDILTYTDINDLAAIIIDTMIPEGGIEMVKKIHEASSFASVPIMILSRYGHEDEISEAFNAGAEDYLMKPLSMVELTARVKRLTEQ